jgi:hypothetical protein
VLVDDVESADDQPSLSLVWPRKRGSKLRELGQPLLQAAYPNLVVIHLPIHASRINQIEIYFSILQRKVLTPSDSTSLDDLGQRILAFQAGYEEMARPFEWKFTRSDLVELLARLALKEEARFRPAA